MNKSHSHPIRKGKVESLHCSSSLFDAQKIFQIDEITIHENEEETRDKLGSVKFDTKEYERNMTGQFELN